MMMQSVNYRLVEFFIIFVLVPVSFAIYYPLWVKALVAVLGFAYVLFVLLRVEKNKFKITKNINWKSFFKHTFLKCIGIAFLTSLFVYFTDKSLLFTIVINKPLLWLMILFIYSFFSVYPQELIYRTFYFERYDRLFQNKNLFIFVNAIVFSLAHLFFRNSLVIILTFLGGLLFAFTYKKTKSTLLVTIEHAIYGCWLFTVGMGEMLGFPS